MAEFHNIFCRSERGIAPAEIARVAHEAWYEDADLTFELIPAGDYAVTEAWQKLIFRVPDVPRPISFLRDVDPCDVQIMVGEAIDEYGDDIPEQARQHLRDTCLVIGVEIYPTFIGNDEWEMINVVEAFIASTLDGIIVADGVYDQTLKPLTP